MIKVSLVIEQQGRDIIFRQKVFLYLVAEQEYLVIDSD